MSKKSHTLLFAALIDTMCLGSEPLDNWQWRNPLPHGNTPNAIAFANGQFVAVGNGGAAAISPDGFHWTNHFIGPVFGPDVTYVLYGLVYGGDRFVAVGFGTAPGRGHFGVILSSPDGVTWTPQACPSNGGFLKTVGYGNGLYVAGGSSDMGGTLLYSADGVRWEQYLTGSVEIEGVAYGGGAYVAVDKVNGLFCSSDPTVGWEQKATPGTSWFEGVTYGAGKFVAVGFGPTPAVSPNACTWPNWPAPENEFVLHAVSYGEGKFVGVGPDSLVAVSSDGSRWSKRYLGRQKDLRSVAYGNGTWVMAGDDGLFFTTTNLTSFENLSLNATTTGNVFRVTYGNGRFVAGGDWGQVLASHDGVKWTASRTGASAFISALTYGAGLFVAVDDQATLFTSTDGIGWTRSASNVATQGVGDLAYGAGHFVLVGYDGTLLTSTNAVDWTTNTSGYLGTLNAVAYGADGFVAAGDAGAVLTSSNALDWTIQDSGTTATLWGVAFGGERFVAVGDGTLLGSPDGVAWAPARTPTQAALTRICFGHGTFTAIGNAGAILTSTNGLDWVARQSGTTHYLSGIAYGQGTFVAVGEAGTILQSEQLPVTGLRLGPLALRLDGTAVFDAAGPTNQTWTVQASGKLVDWTLLAELPGTNATARLFDPGSPNFNHRFYRGWAW